MGEVDAEARIIDISTPLDEHTPAYPGDPVFRRDTVASISEEGVGYNLSMLRMSTHCGTHVDAPRHFIPEGSTIDRIPLHRWISPALVIEISDTDLIEASHLEAAPIRPGDAVILKANADRHACAGHDDVRALSVSAAEYLVSRGINLVGIDALSIEAYDNPAFPVHGILLGNDVLVLEALSLFGVSPGRYTLIAAPLLIRDGDGAPARVFLQTVDTAEA